MTETGTLFGVGTGPGDPELLTLKAVDVIKRADVLAYFAKRGNSSNARRIAEKYVPSGIEEVPLLYPVTTELSKHCEAYKSQIAEFYDRSSEELAAHLASGKSVAVLSEGDPLFYGSYMHIHVRLAQRFRTEVVPGVTAMSGCWSQAETPIAQGDDITTVLPGTIAEDLLTRKLENSEAVIIMKVGRNLAKIRRALETTGRLSSAVYVERATMSNGFTVPLADKSGDDAPYFSIVLVPGWGAHP
ncbi:MAG: precorrin-2 C(20)-methyltransferase [Rhizobiaceae bacterium]